MIENETVEINDTAEATAVKRGKIGSVLNKFFKFYDRGSSVKQEILAGLSVFIISVCALFMNISILCSAFSDSIPYIGMYVASTIIAFIGTLLIGLIANLPLVQCSSLSLSSVFISMIGANTGLTYTNLLAVTFVTAIIYAVLMAVPATRKFIYRAIPAGVRKALPVAVGLYIAYVALQQIGVIDLFSGNLQTVSRPSYTVFCIVMAIVGVLIAVILKWRGSKHPYLYATIFATVLFFLVASLSGTGSEIFLAVFSLNRVFVGINPDPNGEMYTIGAALAEMRFGDVFSTGFDFSAFTAAGGNVFLLFVEGILVFLFMGMYESEGSIRGADLSGSFLSGEAGEKAVGRALFVNSVTNIVAPIFGVAPVSVGKQSGIASGDGGKSGLSSIVCSIGYLVAMFTWVFFIFFATNVPVVPEYGHAGFVFPAVVTSSFQIAAGVMLVLGASMLRGCKECNWGDVYEFVPFALTVIGGVFMQNIVYGVAFGTIAYAILKLFSFKASEIKTITVPVFIMAVLMLLLLIVKFI